MRIRFSKVLSLLLCIAVSFSVCLPATALVPSKAYAEDGIKSTSEPVKILEIQPGTQFDISGNSQLLSRLHDKFGRDIVVDPMPMAEFVSKVDQVNGKYDMVYVGNNNSANEYYCAVGDKSEDLPDSVQFISGKNDVEYYSGIDITNLSAQKIKEFIKSGQLTVFDSTIFNDKLKNTKLYKNFYSSEEDSNFYGNTQYSNFVVVSREITSTLFSSDNGFNGEYYRNKNFENIGNQESCEKIDFKWVEPYWPGPQSDSKFTNGSHDISVRWSTSFKVDASAFYNFAAYCDGDVKVQIAKKSTVSTKKQTKKITWKGDFKSVIDKEDTDYDQLLSGNIYLEEDTEYVLLMEYVADEDRDDNIYAQMYLNTNTINSDKLYESLVKYIDSSIRKRPLLELTSKPVEYNGENAISGANKLMSYKMNMYDQNGQGTLTTRLYVDSNGDGIYTEDESKDSFVTKSGDDKSIVYALPDSYTGLQPWKIEVCDEYGVKNYQTGAVAFKGNELQIHVLQLMPDNNTLGLSSLGDLLKKEGEYNITVDEMKIKDFNNSYNTSKPVQLNGKYDMVILGFADTYKNGDLTTTGAINALDNFIKTNQSVMFTHDTIYTPASASSSSTWGGKNLTKYFRDALGQNIYYDGHQSFPEQGNLSLGLTRLNLDRANDMGMPFTKAAYKLNDTLLSKYPYMLGASINVALTHHQYFQLDLEDPQVVPVFTLDNDKVYDTDGHEIGPVETRFNKLDGRNDYYTYTKGNLTYSGTGHSAPSDMTEKQLFINTMIKASRGANHAPSLTVTGISNNDEIANTTQTLNLDIKAVDDHDKYLGGCIKISADLDGDGIIEDNTVKTFDRYSEDSRLESSVNKSVTINKSVSDTVSNFVVTVEVYDKENAKTTKEITIIQKDEPTLTFSQNINSGYLIGDTVQGSIVVNATRSSTNYQEKYSDITLTAGMDITPEMTKEGWKSISGSSSVTTKLSDIAFTPDPSVREQSKYINFECSGTDGQSKSIPLKLQYTNKANETKEVDSNITYGVKAGGFSVRLVDSNQRGVQNYVNIEKRDDPSFSTLHEETDSSGLLVLDNLTSGEYIVSIDMPEGYTLAPDNTLTRTVRLSYDHPSESVTYNLAGSPVSNLTFTNNSGVYNDINHTYTDQIYVRNDSIVNGNRTARVNFSLNRDITSAELKFESDVPGISITGIITNSDGTQAQCEYVDGRLKIPESFTLNKGDYVININYSMGDNVSSGQYLRLSSTEAISLRETNAAPSDPEDVFSPSPNSCSTVFNVSNSAISGIKLTNVNGTKDAIHVLENGGTQVKVEFTVIHSTKITSMNMRFNGMDISNIVPVDSDRILNSADNNTLEPGSYTFTLYIDGTGIFTSGTRSNLQLLNIGCEEGFDGVSYSSEAVADSVNGSIPVTVDSLYELE